MCRTSPRTNKSTWQNTKLLDRSQVLGRRVLERRRRELIALYHLIAGSYKLFWDTPIQTVGKIIFTFQFLFPLVLIKCHQRLCKQVFRLQLSYKESLRRPDLRPQEMNFHGVCDSLSSCWSQKRKSHWYIMLW